MNQQNFDTYRSNMVCTYDVNVNTITYSQAVEYMANGKCAPYVLESQAGKLSVLLFVGVCSERTNMSVFVWTSATNYFDVWPECYVCGMSLRIFSLKLFDLTLPCEILYNNYTAVLSRCIGDLSTLQCQGDSKSSPKTLSKVTDSCVRNPSEARKSLVNRATALDSYVGWIVASWMSFFRQSDERETHIVRSARPAAHDSDARVARSLSLTLVHVHRSLLTND